MSTAIASLDDPRVAGYRQIADHRALGAAGVFVAEGRLVVRRLLALPRWIVQSVLVTQPALDQLRGVVAALPHPPPIYLVPQPLMNQIAGFHIHRGCLALANRPADLDMNAACVATARRVLLLEGVNNPDNVGGLFRSAAAFGADVVLLGPDCGDPLYRKAVRTSMAATLSVPFRRAGSWPDAITTLRSHGFTVMALTPGADAVTLADTPAGTDRIAVLVGAEGSGLSQAALDAASLRVRIPMTALVDSLNVTTAASIAMYHAFTPD